MAPPLRELLQRGKILLAPGAYDAFSARLIEAAGYDCVLMSGAGISYTRLGQADVGLVNQSEMADALVTSSSSARSSVPVIYTRVLYNENGLDGGVFVRKVPVLRTFLQSNPMTESFQSYGRKRVTRF